MNENLVLGVEETSHADVHINEVRAVGTSLASAAIGSIRGAHGSFVVGRIIIGEGKHGRRMVHLVLPAPDTGLPAHGGVVLRIEIEKRHHFALVVISRNHHGRMDMLEEVEGEIRRGGMGEMRDVGRLGGQR